MPKKQAHAYELPDGTPHYWDKDNPRPSESSAKKLREETGESNRSYQRKLISGRTFRLKAGITYEEFTKLIRRKDLVPICRNAANYSLFDEADVKRIRDIQSSELGIVSKRRGMIDEQCEYTADESYEVLRLFKKGMKMTDVVIETRMHPVVVQSIWRDWVRMNEGLWVSKEDMDLINELPLEGSFPITTSKELYEIMLTASREKLCGQCNERPISGTCIACTRKSIYKAQRSKRMREQGVPQEAEEATFSDDTKDRTRP